KRFADERRHDEARVLEQDRGVTAVQKEHHTEEGRSEPKENRPLQAAFGGQCSDLTPNPVSVADDDRQLVQELGEVPTCLLLHQKRHDENLDLDQAVAPAQVAEGGFGGKAKVLLLVAEGELTRDR